MTRGGGELGVVVQSPANILLLLQDYNKVKFCEGLQLSTQGLVATYSAALVLVLLPCKDPNGMPVWDTL